MLAEWNIYISAAEILKEIFYNISVHALQKPGNIQPRVPSAANPILRIPFLSVFDYPRDCHKGSSPVPTVEEHYPFSDYEAGRWSGAVIEPCKCNHRSFPRTTGRANTFAPVAKLKLKFVLWSTLPEIDNLSEKLRKMYNYRSLIVYNGVEQLGDIIDVKDVSRISRKLKS